MAAAHETRRAAVRRLLSEQDLDALLVTRLVNVRYLTGFTGSNAALLVTSEGAVLTTDGRYLTQSAAQAPDVERVIDRDVAGALVRRAAGTLRRLGFEAHDMTVEAHRSLAGEDRVELRPAGRLVESLRTVKDAGELDALREACAIADRAFAELLPSVRAGRTELEMAHELEDRMRAHGAEARSFETICASGPNSAIPHHRPTGRPVQRGELLKFDFGATHLGYHSDMTRTVIVGPAADWQREIYQVVADAQRTGRAALAPGADVRRVDRAARDVVEQAGYGDSFPHGLGHGVGLEIHEAPTLGYGATGTLDVGVPVTVEPGIYLADRGGVRIEDTLVVTAGEPDLLTTTTKDLLVL
ncbi:MAG: aminopeptidase P family protein [Actinomycetota bacterium]|nr:aminopeptidase P family protein [Actinomycetota bacterium]